MADIRLVWNPVAACCDWTIVDGQLAADSALESVLLLLLFTDAPAQPGYVPDDGSGYRGGVWLDTFEAAPWGSRLWQLRRRKIADSGALAAEAAAMCQEATQPMIDWGIAASVSCTASIPAAGPGQSGTLLVLDITVTLPSGRDTPFRYAVPVS